MRGGHVMAFGLRGTAADLQQIQGVRQPWGALTISWRAWTGGARFSPRVCEASARLLRALEIPWVSRAGPGRTVGHPVATGHFRPLRLLPSPSWGASHAAEDKVKGKRGNWVCSGNPHRAAASRFPDAGRIPADVRGARAEPGSRQRVECRKGPSLSPPTFWER